MGRCGWVGGGFGGDGLRRGYHRPGWGVRPDEHLVFQVEADLDVLTCPEAQLAFSVGQFKRVSARVLGDCLAFDQLDGHPAVFLQGQVVVVALFLGVLRPLFSSCFGRPLDVLGCLFGYYAENAFCDACQ